MRNGTVKGCAIFLCSRYKEHRCCFGCGLMKTCQDACANTPEKCMAQRDMPFLPIKDQPVTMKPCKYCGGKGVLAYGALDGRPIYGTHKVKCMDCGAETATYCNKETPKELWNAHMYKKAKGGG